jgi:DNA-binding LacI/PurR family transcriptional regulator
MESRGRRARIDDVARVAGVSRTAVSFAFHSPGELAPGTAARILEVAESLGYTPRSTAARPARTSAMTVGQLVPRALGVTLADPVSAELCEGVAATTDAAGYGLLLVSPLHGSLERAIADRAVDGFVAFGLGENLAEMKLVRRSGLPAVLVDAEALPEHGEVNSSDEAGARAAARHLYTLGHRRFAVIGIEPPSTVDAFEYFAGPARTVASRRLAGYRQGLQSVGVRLGDSRVVVGPGSFDGGVAAFHRLWEDGLRPTAVLVMSDVMAEGVMWAARELGLRVPRDLSVVGFDDLATAARSNPPLTTVHQPIRQKGIEAARMLLRMITAPDRDRPEHRSLETRLVIRGSTAPAPARERTAGSGRRREAGGGAPAATGS